MCCELGQVNLTLDPVHWREVSTLMPEKGKKWRCGLRKWDWNKGVSRRNWLKLRQKHTLFTGSISKEETCLELQDLRDLWDFSAHSDSELNSGCQLVGSLMIHRVLVPHLSMQLQHCRAQRVISILWLLAFHHGSSALPFKSFTPGFHRVGVSPVKKNHRCGLEIQSTDLSSAYLCV